MSTSALVDIHLLDSLALTSTSTYLRGWYSGVALTRGSNRFGDPNEECRWTVGGGGERILPGEGPKVTLRRRSFPNPEFRGCRWRKMRATGKHNGGRVRNIDVHDYPLLGVARRRSAHRGHDWAIEGRMAGLAAISAQVVEAMTFPFGLCETIPSTRVDFHRNRPICHMCRKVQLGSGVRVRRGPGGCGPRGVGR